MTSHGKRRFGRIFVGVFAATLAIPASAAANVQIGGYLVAPSQVSAYQVSADLAPSAGLMQIGGELIPPSQASAWQASADLTPSAGLMQIGGELIPPSQASAWQASADLTPSAGLMQIGGELIPPSQASAWQASADLAPSARMVQIGGELVAPSRLSAWQTDAWNRAGSSTTLVGQKHDSGFGWGEAGITAGAGLGGLVLLIGASVVTLRRRRMPTTLANMHP